jgi:hypothetical protein
MEGRCRPSPHRGHYWVEEIPESDRWECRWCGEIRHFNQERVEKAQMSEATIGANESSSQEWSYRQADRRASRHIGEGPLESGLGALFSTYSSLSSG